MRESVFMGCNWNGADELGQYAQSSWAKEKTR